MITYRHHPSALYFYFYFIFESRVEPDRVEFGCNRNEKWIGLGFNGSGRRREVLGGGLSENRIGKVN